jgi:hypothetical protein
MATSSSRPEKWLSDHLDPIFLAMMQHVRHIWKVRMKPGRNPAMKSPAMEQLATTP